MEAQVDFKSKSDYIRPLILNKREQQQINSLSDENISQFRRV